MTNNVIYIANLVALGKWYGQVRSLFVSNVFPQTLLEALQEKLQMAINERIERLGELIHKIVKQESRAEDNRSESKPVPKGLYDWWPELESLLRANQNRVGGNALKDRFLKIVRKEVDQNGKHYLHVIKGLSPDASEIGTRWLQGIVDEVKEGAFQIIPLLNTQP